MSQAHADPLTAPCACTALRKATRSVARLYDSHLAHAGLTATQFSILRALERHGSPVPQSRLADELVMERTSLYRALEPLTRAKLVTFSASAADRRVKQVGLTPGGVRRIAQALPHWRAAQGAFLAEFGYSAWSVLVNDLDMIVNATRELPEDTR